MKKLLNKIRCNYYVSSILSQFLRPIYILLNNITNVIEKKTSVNGQTVIYDNFKIKFPKNIGISYSTNIFWKKTNGFEPENYNVLKKLFLASNYFFDIGSNIGFYSVLAKKNNPKLTVFSFEPIKSIFQKNQKFQAINSVRSTFYNIALSFEKSTTEIMLPENSTNCIEEESTATLKKDSWQSRNPHQKHIIQTETLDSIVASHKIQEKANILIKIDVEDFEASVLKGMIKTIHKYKPVIICEILKREHKNKDLLNIVYDINYFVLAIKSTGIFKLEKKYFLKKRSFRDFMLIPKTVLNKSSYISFDELPNLFNKIKIDNNI